MQRQAVLFDLGWTLVVPRSGDWMLTPLFEQTFPAWREAIPPAEMERAQQRPAAYLAENHRLTTLTQEVAQITRWYELLGEALPALGMTPAKAAAPHTPEPAAPTRATPKGAYSPKMTAPASTAESRKWMPPSAKRSSVDASRLTFSPRADRPRSLSSLLRIVSIRRSSFVCGRSAGRGTQGAAVNDSPRCGGRYIPLSGKNESERGASWNLSGPRFRLFSET